MFGIKDTASFERQNAIEPVEEHRQTVDNWVLNELAARRVCMDWNTSPANFLYQWGSPMHARQLEKKLLQLFPNFTFAFNHMRGKMELFQVLPNQSRVSLGFYEPDWMPEYSLFNVKEEWVPLPDVKRISRADVHATDGHAGMEKVTRPWNEVLRGWRTVAAKVVAAHLATPDEVERVFGQSSRAGWAHKMGRSAPSWV